MFSPNRIVPRHAHGLGVFLILPAAWGSDIYLRNPSRDARHSSTKPELRWAPPSVNTLRTWLTICSFVVVFPSRLHWAAAPNMAQLITTAIVSRGTRHSVPQAGTCLSQLTRSFASSCCTARSNRGSHGVSVG